MSDLPTFANPLNEPSAPAVQGQGGGVQASFYPAVNYSSPNASAGSDAAQGQRTKLEDVEFWLKPDWSGWLLDKAKYLKDWRKRWFVLKDGYLFKFLDEAAATKPDSKPRSVLNLKSCLEISQPQRDLSKGPTIEIIKKEYKTDGTPLVTTVYFVCPSISERDVWVRNLSHARSLLHSVPSPSQQQQQQQWGIPTAAGVQQGQPGAAVYPAVPNPSPHAVDLYGETIAKELAGLRLDMQDMKVAISDNQNQNQNQKKVFDDAIPWDSVASDEEDYTDDFMDEDDYMGEDDYEDDYSWQAPKMRCVGVANTFADDSWRFSAENNCGRRIRILWLGGEMRCQAAGNDRSTQKDQWWAGWVSYYNEEQGLHMVYYDDGEQECLDLSSTIHKFTNFGTRDIGRRVMIYWPFEERRQLLSSLKGTMCRWSNKPEGSWFPGFIAECRRVRFEPPKYSENYFVSDAAIIKYDDGDVELLDLNRQQFRYMSEAEENIQVGQTLFVMWRKATRLQNKDLPQYTQNLHIDKYMKAVVTGIREDAMSNKMYQLKYPDMNNYVEELNLKNEEWQTKEVNSMTFSIPK